MVENAASIGDCIGGLVVVDYVVDVLRVCFGEWLSIMSAYPEVAIIRSLITLDMSAELLADREGDDGVRDSDVGYTDTIDGVPLSICN